jgi:capsular exopolysaccharide synthesis family protein
MSIVDALEKAKRLRKERERAEGVARPRRQSKSGSVEATAADITSELAPRRRESVPERPAMTLDLPLVAYHPATCVQNRLLVPENIDPARKGAAASYRQLRTRILQRARGNEWSTLGITSAGPGEGKSLTALNLAISLAHDGNQDVFLVDCDMRNPSLCRYLGVTPPGQITDYFRGTADLESVLFGIGFEHLAIAGGNTSTDQASELLANGRFERMVATIRELSPNPLVLVDLPPVINTDDALVVAPRLDALVLVASEGVTRREQLEQTLALTAEYEVAGVILNRSAEATVGDYYGTSY